MWLLLFLLHFQTFLAITPLCAFSSLLPRDRKIEYEEYRLMLPISLKQNHAAIPFSLDFAICPCDSPSKPMSLVSAYQQLAWCGNSLWKERYMVIERKENHFKYNLLNECSISTKLGSNSKLWGNTRIQLTAFGSQWILHSVFSSIENKIPIRMKAIFVFQHNSPRSE